MNSATNRRYSKLVRSSFPVLSSMGRINCLRSVIGFINIIRICSFSYDFNFLNAYVFIDILQILHIDL